jgi:single-stranded-DNA-specific exonuclease
MTEAITLLREAIAAGRKIRVYGDYDADGVSSTALAARLLTRLGANFDTYIPHRQAEGYGLNVAAVELAAADGVQVLLTVDNGISAVEQIARARELGMTVIVTDHHEPPEVLPEADVIVNPKQPGCGYPFAGLAGVGVMAKVAEVLLDVAPGEALPDELAQIVTIGTIADVMPLVGENRRFVIQGLAATKREPLPGLKALFKEASVQLADVSATTFGFTVGPRINASGRLDSAQPSLALLLADEPVEATRWAQTLQEYNVKRQRLVEAVNQAAMAQVEEKYGDALPGCLVVADADWHPGVVGIAAAKLAELTGRPTFVLGIDAATGVAKGSGRSVGAFDLHEALTACADLLEHYGGHHAAAGLSLAATNLPALAERLAAFADARIGTDSTPSVEADVLCPAGDINLALVEALQTLAPFGAGNPVPRLLIPAAIVHSVKTMGKQNNHLKLQLAGGLEALAFNKGHLADTYRAGDLLELIVETDINIWNNTKRVQLLLQDARPIQRQSLDLRGCLAKDTRLTPWLESPDVMQVDFEYPELIVPNATASKVLFTNRPSSIDQLRAVIRQLPQVDTWVGWFGPTPATTDIAVLPTRERFIRVYSELGQQGGLLLTEEACQTFAKKVGESVPTVAFICDVFEELGFLSREGQRLIVHPAPTKAPLESAQVYQRRRDAIEVDNLITYEQSAVFTAWMETAFAEAHYRKEAD